MESSKPLWSWKEGFRFALCWELRAKEDLPSPLPSNKMEQLGSWIIEPLYKVLDLISRYLRKPLTIVVLTLLVSLVVGVVFYNIPAFIFLGKIVLAKAFRFALFVYTELLFLGMGCKAFGRFHNRSLVEFWKKGKLISVFPGDH